MTQRELPSWAPRLGVALALAALIAWSFAQRWSVLASSPFPLGIDGYYYPVQLRALLDHGTLQYPASPLAFYLLAPFAAVTDPIVGAKLGAACYGALIALPVYGVGAELTREDDRPGRGPGLLAAALATASAGSAYLTIEFVKNGVGLVLSLTALWLVLRALRVPTRRSAGLAIAAIVLAMLTHKMAAGLVLGIAIPAAIVEAHRRGTLRWRRALPLAVALGVAGVILVIGIAMPERFLSPGDLDLIDGLFTRDPDWTLPVLAGKLTLEHEPAIGAALVLAAAVALILERPDRRARVILLALVVQTAGELIGIGTLIASSSALNWLAGGIGLVLALGGMWLRRRALTWPGEPQPARAGAGRDVVAWSVIALGALIALPWIDAGSASGLGMRLRVIAFVPMALCGAIVVARMPTGPLAALVARLPGRVAALLRAVLRHGSVSRPVVAVTLALVVVLIHVGRDRSEGKVVTHPALIASAQAVALPEGGVAVVQERHIAYMVAWYARVPIALRPEVVAPEQRYRVMPLAFIGADSQLDRELIAARGRGLPVTGVHPLHPNGMVVVPEATWRAVLDRIVGPERWRLDAWPTR